MAFGKRGTSLGLIRLVTWTTYRYINTNTFLHRCCFVPEDTTIFKPRTSREVYAIELWRLGEHNGIRIC